MLELEPSSGSRLYLAACQDPLGTQNYICPGPRSGPVASGRAPGAQESGGWTGRCWQQLRYLLASLTDG